MLKYKKDYIKRIKLQLFGNVLESEIDDDTFDEIIEMALEEIGRYCSSTALIEVPASSCIDLKPYPQIKSVVNIYRPNPAGYSNTENSSSDPIYMSQLVAYNFGASYYSNSWIYNYLTYSLNQKIRNTISPDLDFKEDKRGKKLYVNFSNGMPTKLALEYIPQLRDCSEVVEDHWKDLLLRLALAHAKIQLGRIRTRYKQTNAQWEGDGDTILEEGKTELAALRDSLRSQYDYVLPLD